MTHPVDRLAEIRKLQRSLRAEQRAIRSGLLLGEIDTQGSRYKARVRQQIVLLEQAPADTVTEPVQTFTAALRR